MPDTKISAMTSATAVANGDVGPIVQGGANFKATRQLFLSAASGEDITLQGVAGRLAKLQGLGANAVVSVDDTGVGQFNCAVQVNVSSFAGLVTNTFASSVAGGIIITADPTLLLRLATFGQGTLTLFGGANSFVVGGFAALQVQYIPANVGDWVVAPTDLFLAVDRIARVVSNFGATPIP